MDSRSTARRALAGGSSVVALLTTTGYVAVIRHQGNDSLGEVLPWVSIMLTGTFLTATAVLARNPDVGRFASTAAAVVLGLLGLVAIFSVGLGFILAAVLAVLAAVIPSSAHVPAA